MRFILVTFSVALFASAYGHPFLRGLVSNLAGTVTKVVDGTTDVVEQAVDTTTNVVGQAVDTTGDIVVDVVDLVGDLLTGANGETGATGETDETDQADPSLDEIASVFEAIFGPFFDEFVTELGALFEAGFDGMNAMLDELIKEMETTVAETDIEVPEVPAAEA